MENTESSPCFRAAMFHPAISDILAMQPSLPFLALDLAIHQPFGPVIAIEGLHDHARREIAEDYSAMHIISPQPYHG